MEESDNFVKQIYKCFYENRLENATALIKEHKNNAETSNILSAVIPFLVTKVSESSENCTSAESILMTLAEELDPEEVLLQIIDDIDRCVDDETFLALCRVLLRVLLRLPEKRLNSLGWGLNAMQSYLSKINLPENWDLNKDEEMLMDANPVVERVSHLCSALLPFYSALIASCKRNVGERQVIVLKFTLQLLGRPLAFLDLKSGRTTSKARRISESVVKEIFELNSDIFSILELDPYHDIGRVDPLALSTLFYLVLSENVNNEKLPKIYDHVYVFQQSIALVAELFKYESQFVQHNGLSLAQVIVDRVAKNTLSYLLLDSEHHSSFCKALTRVIVYNHSETYRKKALKLYRRYLFLFDARGRYLLVYNLMPVLNHTGIIGFTITQYKDMLVEELGQLELSPYFKSTNLYSILDRFCFLPNQEESDLLELADQIVATLNTFRYLIIRDKKNATGVRSYLEKLEKKYLKPLKSALNLSRGHYELKIKDLGDASTGDGSKVSVTVAGHTLSDSLPDEKIKFLYSALTTFDVIENLVCRVNELIETL